MLNLDWRTKVVAGWQQKRLVDAIELPSGQVDPRIEPYRSLTLVAPDHIESRTGTLIERKSAAEQAAISGKYLFGTDDIIYSKIRPYLRKAYLAEFEGLCSADMYPLRVRAADLTAPFLLHLLLGEHFSRFAEIVSMRSGFPKINRTELAEYSSALPPLPVQRRIAEVLDTIDSAIRKTEQLIQKLKQMKQGLLHDLLTRGIDENGELRDPEGHPEQFGDSPLGMLPKAWEIVHLNTALTSIDAGWSPACDETPPPLGAWGVLKVSAVTSGEYLSHESKTLPVSLRPIPELEVRDGDILVARANGVADLVGVCAEVRRTPPRLMLSDKILRLRTKAEVLAPSFLGFVLKSPIARRQLESAMSGSSGQKNISQTQIRRLLQPLPCLNEQRQVLSILASATSQIEREAGAVNKLRAVKSGLMEDLLTGRVRTTAVDEFSL